MDKQARRNEQEIILVNRYEKELIRKSFEESRYRSKQAMLRDILISHLERMEKDQSTA